MMPFINLHEWLHYGKYATNTALDGFEASDAAVMVIHSEDDSVVSIEYGLDKYYEKYKDDPRFVFKRLKDKGHNYIINDMTYIDSFNVEFDKWLQTLHYDYKAEENKERFKKDKADYIHAHLDRTKWADRLNEEMFREFLAFYDKNLG